MMQTLRRLLRSRKGDVEFGYRLLLIAAVALIVMGLALSYAINTGQLAIKAGNETAKGMEVQTVGQIVGGIVGATCPEEGPKDQTACTAYCDDIFESGSGSHTYCTNMCTTKCA